MNAKSTTDTSRKRKPKMASSDAEMKARLARQLLRAEVAAARAVVAIEGKGMATIDGTALVGALKRNTQDVHAGELEGVEAMLVNQAVSLQALFVRLTERAMGQEDMMEHFTEFLRLALRAQAQSRATIEAIVTMKSPMVVFARQANIASGPQQVNNDLAHALATRETPKPQIELMDGATDGQWLDTRAPQKTVGVDFEMVPLDRIHGSENGGG
jgi:hypothetical protein